MCVNIAETLDSSLLIAGIRAARKINLMECITTSKGNFGCGMFWTESIEKKKSLDHKQAPNKTESLNLSCPSRLDGGNPTA